MNLNINMNIIDPVSNESFSIFSKKGKELLKKYIDIYHSGGSRKSKQRLTSNKVKSRTSRSNRKLMNKHIKKLDKEHKKRQEQLKRLLRPAREMAKQNRMNDFQQNVIDVINHVENMTPEEQEAYIIANKEKKDTDNFLNYLKFRQELLGSGGWIGKGTPILMFKTAYASKNKSPFTRIILFIVAMILSINTIVSFYPDQTNTDSLGLDTYDNQYKFLNEESEKHFRENIEGLSARPGLLYDTRNIEMVLRAWQETPANSSSESSSNE